MSIAIGSRVSHPEFGLGEVISNPYVEGGLIDVDGDMHVDFAQSDRGRRFVKASGVAEVDAPPTVGTLRVQVRLFLGDQDVTDLLKSALS